MTYATLTITTDAHGVTELCLNRPDSRNAMSAQMIAELTDFARNIGPDIRVVVLRGAGQTFCAGGDLGWMQAQIKADRATRMVEAKKLAMMLKALNEMPVPLIGRIHGGAFGGGVGLACVCDVVVAAPGTKFALTETKLGLIPATISPYVLTRMGEGMARRVFMSSRIFDAAEAQTLGIVATVSDDLDAAVAAEVAPYLKVAPGAVGRAKKLARMLSNPIDDAMIDATITQLADAWETPEAAEGIAAFLNKTKPSWA